MNQSSSKRTAQLIVVLLCTLTVKLYYSTASVNQLRWILAPTTFLVELVTGTRFEFESYAGYISNDRSFLIAASCAGVNFFITAFLMLALRRVWRSRSQIISWRFIPLAALIAYVATLVANTVRISTALWLHSTRVEASWLTPNQLHRLEGIFVYFGCLLLLFMVIEKTCSKNQTAASLFRQSLFPLLIYYATTLGIPLANGAYRQGSSFWEHSLFVLMAPQALMFLLATLWFLKRLVDGRKDQVLPQTLKHSAGRHIPRRFGARTFRSWHGVKPECCPRLMRSQDEVQ